MKTKVLFVINRLNLGGVEKSLLSLINAMPEESYDITIGTINKEGQLLPYVPERVKVVEIPELHNGIKNVSKRFIAIKKCLMKGDIKNAFMIPWLSIVSTITRTNYPLYRRYMRPGAYSLEEFDIAVMYQGPNEHLEYYVSHVVKARKKMAWIHFDVDYFFMRKKSVKRSYANFERVLIVSNQAKANFDRRFPMFAHKSEVFLNLINKEETIRLGGEPGIFKKHNDKINIATLGRISWEKGQDKAIYAAKVLKNKGVKFHWWFIGEGNQSDLYKEKAAAEGVDDCITFTGNAINPYPYLAGCDVYVQPSRFEGYCIAIGEAKIFGCPIVASNFMGAHEQLDTVPNSIILPDTEPETIADAILKASKMPKISNVDVGNKADAARIKEIFAPLMLTPPQSM